MSAQNTLEACINTQPDTVDLGGVKNEKTPLDSVSLSDTSPQKSGKNRETRFVSAPDQKRSTKGRYRAADFCIGFAVSLYWRLGDPSGSP